MLRPRCKGGNCVLGHSAVGLHAQSVARASGGKGPVSLKEVLSVSVSLCLSVSVCWPFNDQRTCCFCCLVVFLLIHRPFPQFPTVCPCAWERVCVHTCVYACQHAGAHAVLVWVSVAVTVTTVTKWKSTEFHYCSRSCSKVLESVTELA